MQPTRILLGMAPSDTNLLSIRLATNAELPDAIDLVFRRSAHPQQERQIAAALEEIDRTGPESQIVLVAQRNGTMVAAIWVQIQPGAIASLWPPGLADGEPSATALTLIDLAAAKANSAGSQFLQSLLETDADATAQWLRQSGFQHCTDLLYLVSLRTAFPETPPAAELCFEPCGELPDRMERLAAVVQRTV